MKKYAILFLLMLIISCDKENKTKVEIQKTNTKNTSITLKFLDDYIFPAGKVYKNTTIGGLSEIDYYNGSYYLAVDDANTPRAYKATIKISDYKIDTVAFTDVIFFDKEKHPFYKENHMDLEGLFVEKDTIYVSSEGSISRNKNPFIFSSTMSGNFVSDFKIPEKFQANSPQKPRNNGLFEGLTKSIDSTGFWSGIELPLEADGQEPVYKKTNSPVRITYFDMLSKKAKKEYVYMLEPLARPNKVISINGLTAILHFSNDTFLVVERTYQNGYTNKQNLIKIYSAVFDENTTNSLEIASLSEATYKPLKKELLFDFSSVQSELKGQNIDNIEGITFGPILPNGNKSLILVSDDNFQSFGKQINQFLLLEVIENSK